MTGAGRSRGLAIGLLLSAGLLATIGGGAGIALAALQVAAAVAVARRPGQPGPLAVAALTLVVPPVAAIVHWTAQLPVGCRCQRLPHGPGLVSLTGLVVMADLALIGLAVLAVSRPPPKRWENPPLSDCEPTGGGAS